MATHERSVLVPCLVHLTLQSMWELTVSRVGIQRGEKEVEADRCLSMKLMVISKCTFLLRVSVAYIMGGTYIRPTEKGV